MRRENTNKLLHLFLLALFLCYYGNITFFSHFHVVNGVTIVHSHAFCGHNPDGSAKHTHTAREITLIAQLSTFITVVTATLGIAAPCLGKRIHYYISQQVKEPARQLFTLSPLRAPPVIA